MNRLDLLSNWSLHVVVAGCALIAPAAALGAVRDGSTEAGRDLAYQYAAAQAGAGVLHANWDPHPNAVRYIVDIGTSPGGSDVVAGADVGLVTSWTATNLSLQQAHTGTTYYVSVTPVLSRGSAQRRTSNGVRIAEGRRFTGAAAEFGTVVQRTPAGGFSLDFPTGSGLNTIFGDHYFETVEIPAGVTVHVQPFGKEDQVPEATPASDARVQSPRDGWVRLYANTITIDGKIDARGRGFGGGGGAGSEHGPTDIAHGGENGLSGNGGDCLYQGHMTLGGDGLGAGGGGSNCWYGALDIPGYRGGNGGLRGGGGFGAGKFPDTMGQQGNPDDSTGGHGNPDGAGEAGGGGGGGYGAGGGGASSPYGAGGGGGGTCGYPGESTVYNTPCAGGSGCGPAAGAGGDQARLNDGEAGHAGGYRAPGRNGDNSTDEMVWLGSGGGGGSRHDFEGGGGGGAGGGAVSLVAAHTLTVRGQVLASGAAGGGGGLSDAWNTYAGAGGGGGGGGGILLKAPRVDVNGATIRTLGGLPGESTPMGAFAGKGGDGDASTVNGGTIKVFRGALTGALDAGLAGRIFEANLSLVPSANAGGPYVGISGVLLDASGSSDPTSSIVSWQWDLDSDGAFDDATGEYVPFNAPAQGTYDIRLKVTNALGYSAEATSRVEVRNASVHALPDVYSTPEDMLLDVPDMMGVLSNDTDAEDDPMEARLATGPSNGTVELRTNGSFQYLPRQDFTGTDTFTYRVFDGHSLSEPALVTIRVSSDDDVPTAHPDLFEGNEDSTLHVLPDAGVLFNDEDDGDSPLIAQLVAPPQFGTFQFQPNGAFTYTPPPNFSGMDTFSYRAVDAVSSSAVTAVSILIHPVQDPPTFQWPTGPQHVAGMEGMPLHLVLRAADVDGDTLQFNAAPLPPGAVFSSQSGVLDWRPAVGQAGDYALLVSATDGHGWVMQSLTIRVQPLDSDADGLSDADEERLGTRADRSDSDGDGIPDNQEPAVDSDGDGIIDPLDTDSDDDSLPDALEAGDDDPTTPPVDTDEDGIPDLLDDDSDGDTIPDAVEAYDPAGETLAVDTDADGRMDFQDVDSDDDGLSDAVEAGDDDPLTAPRDSDHDGVPDFRDADSDDDGVLDRDESAGQPVDTDGDDTPDHLDLDSDEDGIPDIADNCRTVVNRDQANLDEDARGDACDPDADDDGLDDAVETMFSLDPRRADSDGDGIIDSVEFGTGSEPLDTDRDGEPDALDADSDNDGVPDLDEQAGTSELVDTDGDGIPDVRDTDADGDGVIDGEDSCRLVADAENQDGSACADDFDGDGQPDAQDNCPTLPNPSQEDSDGDTEGNTCDPDDDDDGRLDPRDNCPQVANKDQRDADDDGVGDACEPPPPSTEPPAGDDDPPPSNRAPLLLPRPGCQCAAPARGPLGAGLLLVVLMMARRRR